MSCRAALTAVLIMAGAPAGAGALPTRVGACVVTAIESVETRLADGATHQPMPGSGGAVCFANGGYQVSYDTVPAIEESRKGANIDRRKHLVLESAHPSPLSARSATCWTRVRGDSTAYHIATRQIW